jgi:hypothetical protein
MDIRRETLTVEFERDAKRPLGGELCRWLKSELDVNVGDLVAVEHEFGSKKVHLKFKKSEKMSSVIDGADERKFVYEDGTTTRVTLATAGFGVKIIRVRNLPIEFDNQHLRTAVSEYGNVQNVFNEVYSEKSVFKGLFTGVRVVRITMKMHIPSYVMIKGVEAYVEYSGQPKTCQVCGAVDHLRAACPNRRRGGTYASRLRGQASVPETPVEGVGGVFFDNQRQRSDSLITCREKSPWDEEEGGENGKGVENEKGGEEEKGEEDEGQGEEGSYYSAVDSDASDPSGSRKNCGSNTPGSALSLDIDAALRRMREACDRNQNQGVSTSESTPGSKVKFLFDAAALCDTPEESVLSTNSAPTTPAAVPSDGEEQESKSKKNSKKGDKILPTRPSVRQLAEKALRQGHSHVQLRSASNNKRGPTCISPNHSQDPKRTNKD